MRVLRKSDDNILNISPPFNNKGLQFDVDTLFGIAEGSLALMIAFRQNIVVYVCDDNWGGGGGEDG